MNIKYLDKIESPRDVKRLPEEVLPELADEIRRVLIGTVSENGGHLASNLGVVELTIALHRVFDSPTDKIIWDVGHQCYVHKLLTGRYREFGSLRKFGGISGFTRRDENENDILSSGHSSVSVSAAYGIACANKINNSDAWTVAVVGDGAFTGGMIYEALNNAGRSKTKLIVILNDNEMSISPNVGSFAKYLASIKARPEYFRFKEKTEKTINKIPVIGSGISQCIYDFKTFIKNTLYDSTMFENLGFRYIGPIDGHDINAVCTALYAAKEVTMPVVLHINTVKGKGYELAEKSPVEFHGLASLDPVTGEKRSPHKTYSDAFGDLMCREARSNKKLCAVTAAMGVGTGLSSFAEEFPSHFFDVGIAEEHGVTFSSGLARGGMLPVFAVYSSFLQRGYDQLIHDTAMQKLKTVFAVDRAGFVGEDGESHHGLFDAAFLCTVPGMSVYSPCTFSELEQDFLKAFYESEGPAAVRYPRGTQPVLPDDYVPGCADWEYYGDKKAPYAIVTYGRIFEHACAAVNELKNSGLSCAVIKLSRIKPIDSGAIAAALKRKYVFFFEEGEKSGGIGECYAEALLEAGFKGKYHLTAVEDEFVKQGEIAQLLSIYNLDKNGMIKIITEALDGGKNQT